jgi:(1->4)-alpha-D-glucan 1-alpha-D-glucosylmutase
MSMPRATVRLQLHRDFGFDAAAACAGYYAELGISHYYLSPIWAARPGSLHGYDVIDPTRVNPELGGEEGLLRLAETLRRHGMGLVVDLVPNHMGIAGGTNRYWESVLAWGRRSPWAHWFDIDWDVPDPRLRGKLLCGPCSASPAMKPWRPAISRCALAAMRKAWCWPTGTARCCR